MFEAFLFARHEESAVMEYQSYLVIVVVASGHCRYIDARKDGKVSPVANRVADSANPTQTPMYRLRLMPVLSAELLASKCFCRKYRSRL